MPFRVGDMVLASPDWDESLKEPASVLEVDCEYENDEGETRHDGILVKFSVSVTKTILPPEAVAPYQEDRKRSSRRSAAAATSPTTTINSSTSINRSLVTPSPTAANISNSKMQESNEEEEIVTTTKTTAKARQGRAVKKEGTVVKEQDSDDEEVVEIVEPPSKATAKTRGKSKGKDEPKQKKAPAKKAATKKTNKKGADNEETNEKKTTKTSTTSTSTKKRSRSTEPAKKSAAKKKKKDNDTAMDTEEEKQDSNKDDPTVESPYFNKKAKKPKTEETKTKKTPATKKAPASKKTAPKKKKPNLILSGEEEAKQNASDSGYSNVSSDSENEDDDDDKPFQVEYATSGRATCRRCDQVIPKGAMRISHVPLFRGKPGFRVYRHPECIVFSEQVQCVEDVGGYKTIKRTSKKDFLRLTKRVEESKIELEKENEELQPDELVPVTFQGEMRKPAEGLTANLLPFQVEGVSWMYHQETQIPELHGGILADEMGMGKTLQTIATILDNRPVLQHSKPGAKHPPSLGEKELEARKRESDLWDKSVEEWTNEMEMNNVPKKMWPKKQKQAARAGTLVVCPVIALTQWKAELERFTAPGTFTISVYHGPNRAKDFPIDKLTKYDVVLTTYQVLEADFRKMVSPNKVTCPNCGSKFKIDKLRVHLKYFCGEGAERTEAQARQQRTADRQNRRGGGGGGGGGSGKGGSKGNQKKKSFDEETKKPPMASTKTKKATKSAGKKRAAKKVESSDSEDDSMDEVEMTPTTPTTRPSRSAAETASKRMSTSMNDWTSGNKGGSSDDESFGGDGESETDDEGSVMSYDEEDSDGEVIPSKKPAKKKAPRKRAPTKKARKSNVGKCFDISDSEASDDDDSAARVIKRQQAALKQVKTGKGKKTAKGKGGDKAKGKGGKKKFKDESSSSDESDDDVNPNRDPLAGIDLDGLMKEAMDGSQMSLLHSVCWWRIVLDEAHMIKSRQSQTAAAAFALVGVNRWALSGTPLQNRVGELYSLIRFIRIDPMAHYFCRSKGCGCKSIHYRIKHGVCLDCGHRGFQHFSHFNKHVLNPIQRDGYSGDGRRAMFTLKNEVLDKCLLRRTKETRAEDMNLPPRIVSIRTIQLHPVEKDFYDALYTQTKSSFSDYVAQGTLLNNYAHIFDLLTRMRQAVDHPYMIVYSKRNCDAAAAVGSGNQPQVANGSTDCDICQEPPTERVVSSCCGAAFCRACVVDYMMGVGAAGEGGTPCPSCRAPFSIDLNQASADGDDELVAEKPSPVSYSGSPKFKDNANGDLGPSLSELKHVTTGSILRRINLAEFATSTKIEALVQELVEMRQKRPGSKALVFSQFTSMLDLIRWRLHADPGLAEMGLGARILHGSMDRKSRDDALRDFKEDGSVRVLLMSLKAGGVALNLTVASEVFLVDNWWNPAAEMQAIDRTHRLGQHRCIRAVRFIAEGTVEERVLQLQEKKRLVFDGTVGRDAGSLKMLTVDDMHSLFQ